MKKNILKLLVSTFLAQNAAASCEDFSNTQNETLILTHAPQDLSDQPVGLLDLDADLLTLDRFKEKEIARKTNPLAEDLSKKLGKEIDIHVLNQQIKPFLSKTPPKKSIDTIRKFELMQTTMTDFFINFHCLFNVAVSNECDELFGHISTESNHHVHMLFQNTSRAFLRLSNAYCSLLENKDPALFQNFYGTIPSKGERRALGYLKENENFLLFPLGGVEEPLFLGRQNHTPQRNSLTSGILYKNEKIVTNPGIILIYDRYLERFGKTFPWQVSLYSGAHPSSSNPPFMLCNKNILLTSDFFETQTKPTGLNCSINGQAIKALFMEDVSRASLDKPNAIIGFFEFPQSEMDNNLVDLLLLEDLIEGTQSPSDADPTLSNTQTSLLLTHMCSFYKKEPEDILKEKEEALVEKIAQEIRQSYTPTTTTTSLENTPTRDKKKTRGTPNKRGGNSRHAKSTNPTTTHKKMPSEESILREARNKLKALKIEGRLKWGAVLKRVNQVCSDLPTLSDNSAVSITGSHIVVHTPKSSPITLVKPHKGRDAIFPDTARSFFMDLIMTGLKQNGS